MTIFRVLVAIGVIASLGSCEQTREAFGRINPRQTNLPW